MKTSEILNKINIPRHKLYYLEQKGYVSPKRIPMGDLEAREFTLQDFELIKAIWKYLQKGFKHKAAYQRATGALKAARKDVRHEDEGREKVFSFRESR